MIKQSHANERTNDRTTNPSSQALKTACELDDDEGRGAVSPPGMARKSASVLPGVGVTHVTLEVGDGLDSL